MKGSSRGSDDGDLVCDDEASTEPFIRCVNRRLRPVYHLVDPIFDWRLLPPDTTVGVENVLWFVVFDAGKTPIACVTRHLGNGILPVRKLPAMTRCLRRHVTLMAIFPRNNDDESSGNQPCNDTNRVDWNGGDGVQHGWTPDDRGIFRHGLQPVEKQVGTAAGSRCQVG